jgi:hypothetical protein
MTIPPEVLEIATALRAVFGDQVRLKHVETPQCSKGKDPCPECEL